MKGKKTEWCWQNPVSPQQRGHLTSSVVTEQRLKPLTVTAKGWQGGSGEMDTLTSVLWFSAQSKTRTQRKFRWRSPEVSPERHTAGECWRMNLQEQSECDHHSFQFLLKAKLFSAAYNKAAKLVDPRLQLRKWSSNRLAAFWRSHG